MESKGPSTQKGQPGPTETKNFRSYYYRKVACGIVDSNITNMLLANEKLVDLNKLTQFLQRFNPPPERRSQIWMYLLGVIPNGCTDATRAVVKAEQKLLCDHLISCLKAVRFIDNLTPSSTLLLFMFLLEQGELRSDFQRQMKLDEMKDLSAIAATFLLENSTFEESYWLFRNFTLQRYQRGVLHEMAERFTMEDNELEAYFKSINAYDCIPVDVWFSRLYCGIIHKDFLLRIWDRLVIGSLKVLPLTGRAILQTLKSELLQINSGSEIRERLLMPLPLEVCEKVASMVVPQ